MGFCQHVFYCVWVFFYIAFSSTFVLYHVNNIILHSLFESPSCQMVFTMNSFDSLDFRCMRNKNHFIFFLLFLFHPRNNPKIHELNRSSFAHFCSIFLWAQFQRSRPISFFKCGSFFLLFYWGDAQNRQPHNQTKTKFISVDSWFFSLFLLIRSYSNICAHSV